MHGMVWDLMRRDLEAYCLAASSWLGLLGNHVLCNGQPELALQGRLILGPVGHHHGQLHIHPQRLSHRILDPPSHGKISLSYSASDIYTLQHFLFKCSKWQNKVDSLLCTAILGCSGSLG